MLTLEDLATRWAVRPSWIYAQVALKAIPFTKIGRFLRFDPAAIDAYEAAHSECADRDTRRSA
jgi:hypothetical protein